jgi:hypothetical protein
VIINYGGIGSSQINVLARYLFDGTPYEVKVSCTVWSGGKVGDIIKILPITIKFTFDEGNKSWSEYYLLC